MLEKDKDPMGQAIAEYYKKGHAVKLRVFSSMFYEDNIPVKTLFRDFANMPPLEQKMLSMAEGRVLDVGAGSGCHSLELMKMGREVVAIDISALSVEVMTDRGVDARQVDFFDETFAERFDTIIMAMNGIGIVGRVERLPEKFTIKELQNLYEAILDVNFDRRNFYNKMKRFEILDQLEERAMPTPKKEAFLFRFNAEKYQELKQKGFRLEF